MSKSSCLRLIGLLIFTFVLCSFLCGCTGKTTTVINKNQYYQTDYNYFCLEEGKTWSQMVTCLVAENKAERTQNKITNDMLAENE